MIVHVHSAQDNLVLKASTNSVNKVILEQFSRVKLYFIRALESFQSEQSNYSEGA